MATAETSLRDAKSPFATDLAAGRHLYDGSRIPQPIPTILLVPPELEEAGDVLTVNFGPNHPSTHGVLRLVVSLDGETVVGLYAVIGYLHTGFEKNMEQKTYWKAITYPARMDYLNFQQNELCFVMAIEKLLGVEPPPKAIWMRTLLAELARIHSHLVWLGTTGLELGAISIFWYAFRERDLVLDLFEMVTGVRMHTRYFQAGGLAEDIPPGFDAECRRFVDVMPKRVDEYEALFDNNVIFLERTRGVGLLSAEDAIALGQSGPMLRASGVNWDLRRAALSRLSRARLRRPRLPGWGRVRPLQDPHGRDPRVGSHHPSVPRRHAGRAVDRGRPEDRAPAARASSTPRWRASSTTSSS